MKKVFIVFGLLLLLAVAPGFAEENPVLAKVGNKKITLSDFNRVLGYYDADKQKLAEQSPQIKVTLLKRYVQAMVLSSKAIAEGLDKRADIKEKKEMLLDDYFANEYLKTKLADSDKAAPVVESDVKIYYKAYKEEFTLPEEVSARHILVRVDSQAPAEVRQKAKEKAEHLLKKLKAGADFARLASEVSEDPGSKEKGGDLGFFKKGTMLPEFEKTAFAQKAGELSAIVETQFGFHIIKVEAKKDAVIQPLDKVYENIKEKIRSDRKKSLVEALIDNAMKGAGVEMNFEPFMPKQ